MTAADSSQSSRMQSRLNADSEVSDAINRSDPNELGGIELDTFLRMAIAQGVSETMGSKLRDTGGQLAVSHPAERDDRYAAPAVDSPHEPLSAARIRSPSHPGHEQRDPQGRVVSARTQRDLQGARPIAHASQAAHDVPRRGELPRDAARVAVAYPRAAAKTGADRQERQGDPDLRSERAISAEIRGRPGSKPYLWQGNGLAIGLVTPRPVATRHSTPRALARFTSIRG